MKRSKMRRNRLNIKTNNILENLIKKKKKIGRYVILKITRILADKILTRHVFNTLFYPDFNLSIYTNKINVTYFFVKPHSSQWQAE